MRTPLTLPTIPDPALRWLREVPRWRIQGYRVHRRIGSLLSRAQTQVAAWPMNPETAALARTWRSGRRWVQATVSVVLVPEEKGV